MNFVKLHSVSRYDGGQQGQRCLCYLLYNQLLGS